MVPMPSSQLMRSRITQHRSTYVLVRNINFQRFLFTSQNTFTLYKKLLASTTLKLGQVILYFALKFRVRFPLNFGRHLSMSRLVKRKKSFTASHHGRPRILCSKVRTRLDEAEKLFYVSSDILDVLFRRGNEDCRRYL